MFVNFILDNIMAAEHGVAMYFNGYSSGNYSCLSVIIMRYGSSTEVITVGHTRRGRRNR